MKRYLANWFSPSTWALLAMLSIRGAGFIVTFVLARTAGQSALGLYSAIVNTSSSLAMPFAGVAANNATMMVARASAERSPHHGAVWRANLLLALCISGGSLLVLLGGSSELFRPLIAGYSHSLVLVAASCVVAGQLCVNVLQGLYQGSGAATRAGRLMVATAAVIAIAAWPVTSVWGLNGTLGLLVFSSIAPSVALVVGAGIGWVGRIPQVVWKELRSRLLSSIPTVAATTLGAAVSWLCTVYYVEQFHGVAAIGLLAIATQWLTLMLLPATSWGGMTLRAIVEVQAQKDARIVRRRVFDLVGRNLMVTLVLGVVVGASAAFIASAYKLGDSDLVEILWINCLIGLVSAANNVMERLFLCINRQSLWLILSLPAFGLQLAITRWWIHDSLLIVPLGVLAATVCQAVLSFGSLNRLIATHVGDDGDIRRHSSL